MFTQVLFVGKEKQKEKVSSEISRVEVLAPFLTFPTTETLRLISQHTDGE
jgi:hypothetical protein